MTTQNQTVTVYTKPGCQPCMATKRALTVRGIEFTEESILDEANMRAAKALGHQSAPVVVVTTDGKDESWSGYDPARIEALVAA